MHDVLMLPGLYCSLSDRMVHHNFKTEEDEDEAYTLADTDIVAVPAGLWMFQCYDNHRW